MVLGTCHQGSGKHFKKYEEIDKNTNAPRTLVRRGWNQDFVETASLLVDVATAQGVYTSEDYQLSEVMLT